MWQNMYGIQYKVKKSIHCFAYLTINGRIYGEASVGDIRDQTLSIRALEICRVISSSIRVKIMLEETPKILILMTFLKLR